MIKGIISQIYLEKMMNLKHPHLSTAMKFLLGLAFLGLIAAGCGGPSAAAPQPTYAAAAAPTQNPQVAQLQQIDRLLETIQGSLAFNTPTSMALEDTTTIQLLISPTLSEDELKNKVQANENQPVASARIDITPRMKAELKSADPDAFTIQPVHDQAEQLLSTGEPTEWKWLVQAKKDGPQTLTVTVYRLVQFDGKDYWREKTYEKNIDVRVTLPGLIRRFNWEWLVGLVFTALLVPLLFRYLDRRAKRTEKRSTEE